MNYIPKNINSWEKLQQLIRVADDRILSNPKTKIKILIYSPWNESSTKFRGYDAKVNLFEVPEALSILNEYYGYSYQTNSIPVLINLTGGDGSNSNDADRFVVMTVTDNTAGIDYELTSNG
jgi:hypothetical protein